MDRNSVDWKGYWPASPTPFNGSGEIDWQAFDQLLDWYLERGIHGLFVNGTTGEWFSQSNKERRAIAEFLVKKVEGRIPVVIGLMWVSQGCAPLPLLTLNYFRQRRWPTLKPSLKV
jgi:4-hydroxy-tetrahydrodipicolinate synthase